MEMLEISDGTNDVKSGTEIKIDYFSGTFEFRNFSDDDELKDVEGTVEAIANLLNVPKEETSKPLELSYQDGACNDIDSNFLIHLSDTPKT